MVGAALAECEAAKSAGNAAVAAKDFVAAERHYGCALGALPQADADLPEDALRERTSLRATLLCNRSMVRLKLSDCPGSASDATAALELLPEGSDPKMRAKALYRRALARETLGELQGAFSDLNLALKIAPTNDGIRDAAQRLQALVPRAAPSKAEEQEQWTPAHKFNTASVMRLASPEHHAGALKGYSARSEDPVVRFACGLGVQAWFETGGSLQAIRAYGPPRVAPRDVDNYMASDWHARPNFPVADGLCVKYDKAGHLSEILRTRDGLVDGPHLHFFPDGKLDVRRSASFVRGEMDSGYVSAEDAPAAQIARALVELAVPVKRALQIALSPGEQKLCDGLRLNAACIRPADLDGPGPAAAEHRQWEQDRAEAPLQEKRLVLGDKALPYGPLV